jgi:hypothetical protein
VEVESAKRHQPGKGRTLRSYYPIKIRAMMLKTGIPAICLRGFFFGHPVNQAPEIIFTPADIMLSPGLFFFAQNTVNGKYI